MRLPHWAWRKGAPWPTSGHDWCFQARESENDFKTIDEWARTVGVSGGSLREMCRLLKIQPHDARDLARLFRAIHLAGPSGHFELMLDVADSRTLRALLDRVGGGSGPTRPSLSGFLLSQTFVVHDNLGLVRLREMVVGIC